MRIEYKDPSDVVFCELCIGSYKIELYRYNVHGNKLRV
jgi:hypothetical protein